LRRRAAAKYPLPPLLVEQAGAAFDAGARKLGYTRSTPRAILLAALQRPAGLHLLRLLPGLRLPRRRQVVDPRHQLPDADKTGNSSWSPAPWPIA
jgi:hypothetical protein